MSTNSSDPKERAQSTLVHYFNLLAKMSSGEVLDSDCDIEIRLAVEDIVDAAVLKAELRAKLDAESLAKEEERERVARRYVVRVAFVEPPTEFVDLVVAMQWAGYVAQHDVETDSFVFDILPPADMKSTQTETWAEMLANRISSLGLNAVRAPEWK